jgi:hypothetical protein
MQLARDFARILAGEKEPHDFGGARRPARREKPPERCLACRELLFQAVAPRGERRGFRAQPAALGRDCGERPGRLRNRGLGLAQRVTRLAALGFAAVQLGAQRLNLRAQRLKVFCARRRRCDRQRGERGYDEEAELQPRTLPCADTAAMRRAISSASPR